MERAREKRKVPEGAPTEGATPGSGSGGGVPTSGVDPSGPVPAAGLPKPSPQPVAGEKADLDLQQTRPSAMSSSMKDERMVAPMMEILYFENFAGWFSFEKQKAC
eukprot:7720424-Pyramimonas_sp.AAC.1